MTEPRIRPLGDLERAIMDALWRRAPRTVKDVAQALVDRELAYTTVMTTLDRLHKKGVVVREKNGHAFDYWPALDQATFERRLIASLLGELQSASPETLLSGFLDAAGDDVAVLDALETLIAERKRRRDAK